MKKVDVLIAGAGVAGLSAGIYAGRYGLDTLIVGEIMGGAITTSHCIENYPGFSAISPFELVQKMQQQAQESGCAFLSKKISGLKEEGTDYIVTFEDGESLSASFLLLALGTKHRHLNIKGEKELVGKGVSYCATCDGMFFRGREVAIVGGGNSALTEALYLASICKKVYIIHRRDTYRAEKVLVDQVKEKENIEEVLNALPVEIQGAERVEHVVLDGGRQIDVSGVFVAVGYDPDITLASQIGLALNERNHILVNEKMQTNKRGVYAAGDITSASDEFKQVVISVAEGALAAKNIHEEFVKQKK